MKNRVRYAVFAFLVEVRGFEPRSTRPYSALSTRLVGDWIVSRFGSPTNLASMISCWQQSYREIRLRCLFFWRRLPRKQKTSGRRADLNYAARANSILELFWLFFAFNFNFRFYAAEPATCLYRFKLSVESSTPPLRHNQRRRFNVKWL